MESFVLAGGPNAGSTQNCDWAMGRPDACGRFGKFCPVSCGLCGENGVVGDGTGDTSGGGGTGGGGTGGGGMGGRGRQGGDGPGGTYITNPGFCPGGRECPSTTTTPFLGQPSCVNATKPHQWGRGLVGCVDPPVLIQRPTVLVGDADRSANNIYGPTEAGFTQANPKMKCLGSENTIPGGLDIPTAVLIARKLCGDETMDILDSCGGHAVPYHYHKSMSCLYESVQEGLLVGHSTRVGTALDGNGIYGHHVSFVCFNSFDKNLNKSIFDFPVKLFVHLLNPIHNICNILLFFETYFQHFLPPFVFVSPLSFQ